MTTRLPFLCFNRDGFSSCFLHQVCVKWWPEEAVWEAGYILRPLRRAHPCVVRVGWVETDYFLLLKFHILETITRGWHPTLIPSFCQGFMWLWSCHVGGASMRTSPGRTAWQHWWEVTSVERTRPPGWPDEPWCDTPTSLACSSTALSALPSTRGFPPWSIWCRQVRCGNETAHQASLIAYKTHHYFRRVCEAVLSSTLCLFLSGLMTSEELRHLEDLPSPHNKFWVPCMWFVSLALRARTEGRINNDVALTAILTVGLRVLSVCRPERLHFVEIHSSETCFFFFLPVLLFFSLFRSWIVYGQSVWSCTVTTGSACLLSILRFCWCTVLGL